jgi:hypothetical protein
MHLSVFIGYSKADAGTKVTKEIITKLQYTMILTQNGPI